MMDTTNDSREPLAIIGIGAIFPDAVGTIAFCRNILSGRDSITEVPAHRWLLRDFYDPDKSVPDKTYCKRGAFLPEVDFDPIEFGLPPSALPATDPAQLYSLLVAKEALTDACRGDFTRLPRSETSVVLGASPPLALNCYMSGRLGRGQWMEGLLNHGISVAEAETICNRITEQFVDWQEDTFPGMLSNVIAGRVASRYNLGGSNFTVDAACASSLAALAVAANELYLHRARLVITGGGDGSNGPIGFVAFSKTPALSPTHDIRPFSGAADGTILGEGFGMLALKRLSDAERDGDRIYATVRGVGTSSDGRAKSIYAPNTEGQKEAFRRAYREAGISPATVELLEAHGTATKVGDSEEFETSARIFDESGRKDRQWCAFGSIKSQIGHTKIAAGVAGMIKAILALHHKVLPPTLKIDEPNPSLDLEHSPLYLNTRARPWIRGPEHPRRAAVSAFGFGGTNGHVILEEYRGPGARPGRFPILPAELVLFAAKTTESLQRVLSDVAAGAPGSGHLAAAARRSQVTFDPALPARIAIVASNEAELAQKLKQAATLVAEQPQGGSAPGIEYGFDQKAGEIAFLFPGQGSQYVYMGADLAMAFPAACAVWDRSAALSFAEGRRLHELVFPPPAFSPEHREEQRLRLTETAWAQPAIGATSMAQLSLLRLLGVSPMCVCGHSFGELTALHAAGVIDASAVLQLGYKRGSIMADAARLRPGAMLAVSAGSAAVEPLMPGLSDDLVIAGYNSPRQTVLSGAMPAIETMERRLDEAALRRVRLPVTTAFHSPILAPARDELLHYLQQIALTPPTLPVYSNVTGGLYPEGVASIPQLLADQLVRPVRFIEIIDALYAAGARTFVEVGPGSALAGLVDECLDERPHRTICLDRKGQNGVAAFWHGIGKLAVAGVPLDFERFFQEFERVQEEAKPPKLSVRLDGELVGQVYPPHGLEQPGPPRVARPSAGTNVTPSSTLQPPSTGSNPAPTTRQPPPSTGSNPAPTTRQPPTSTGSALAYFEALRSVQQRAEEAHALYQKSLTEAHTAFLRTAELTITQLGALALGSEAYGAPPAAPVDEAAERAGVSELKPREVAPLAVPPQAIPSPIKAATDKASPTPGAGVKQRLFDVVAHRTGYPAEVLQLDMDLEADLGIDSLKRAEIFATMKGQNLREAAAKVDEREANRLMALRTLGQIVDYISNQERVPAATTESAAPIAAPAAPLPALEEHTPAPALQVRHVVETAPPSPGTLLAPGTLITVVDNEDGGDFASVLVAEFESRGWRTQLQRRSADPDAAAVLYLGGLRPLSRPKESTAVHAEALAIARTVAPRMASMGGRFVTVSDLGGDFGLSARCGDAAYAGGLSGLIKTLALEWPQAEVKAIDLELRGGSPQTLAARLADEFLAGGRELEVGLCSDGRRVTLQLAAADRAFAEVPRLHAGAVVVVSGGARGITVDMLCELAKTLRPRLVLLGRTPLSAEPNSLSAITDEAELHRVLLTTTEAGDVEPSPRELKERVNTILATREVRRSLQRLTAAGADVRYVQVDVTDEPAVTAALAAVRNEFGPIRALVHAAGVLADKLVVDKTSAQFERVFRTKVEGLRVLLDATRSDPLEVICLFSSIAAITGSRGQADYAMANEVLNKVALVEALRRAGRCAVKSINWGPMEGGMVTPALQSLYRSRGVPLLKLSAAARCFVDELLRTDAEPCELIVTTRAEHE